MNLSFSGTKFLSLDQLWKVFSLVPKDSCPPTPQAKWPELSQVDIFPTQGSSGPLLAGFGLSCDSCLKKVFIQHPKKFNELGLEL